VQELDRTGDATGFHCSTHGDFKVADTVFAEAKAKHYSREQWEAALDKAKEREPEGWPLVITDDFFWRVVLRRTKGAGSGDQATALLFLPFEELVIELF
jgi:hypothetical protein